MRLCRAREKVVIERWDIKNEGNKQVERKANGGCERE